jgi:hypothetical protein
MKTAPLCLIYFILLASTDIGFAQGYRGGAARAGSGWSRSPGFVGRQQFQGTIRVPSGVAVAPHVFRHEGVPRQGIFFGTRHWSFGFPRAPFVHRFGRVPFAPVGYYYPYRYYYPRYFGGLIIDVPSYSGTMPGSQYVPGVVYRDRQEVEESSGQVPGRGPGQIAPFDPTPPEVVERMLVLANVRRDDLLYDLGSGDGRMVITAAKKFGVKAVGFEIDAGLVKLARENAKREGIEHLVEFRHEDFLAADLSLASVVMLYLSYDGNLAVRSQLMQQLKPGARVVSYTFDMGDWSPRIAESYRDATGNTHMLYLWEAGGLQAVSEAK